jgi:hypothetical protein
LAASPLGPHSWDPGISPTGVFWTAAVPPGSVKFDFDDEKASLRVRNVLVFDAFTLPNALDEAHPAGRVTSLINLLQIDWSGTTRATSFSNCEVNGFRGDYFEDSATIKVIATTPPTPARSCPPRPARNGFRFVSDATTVNHFSQIGRERNGVFF